jgi:hypothetical protein
MKRKFLRVLSGAFSYVCSTVSMYFSVLKVKLFQIELNISVSLSNKIGDAERDYVRRMGRARIEYNILKLPIHDPEVRTITRVIELSSFVFQPRLKHCFSFQPRLKHCFSFQPRLKDEIRPRGPSGYTPAIHFYNGKT